MKKAGAARGILLVEVLLGIAFMAALVAIGTQVSLVTLTSTTASEEKDVAHRLAREMLEGARLASMSNWYALAYADRAGTHHATTTTSSTVSWTVAPGAETLMVGSHEYTRSFTVASTSRDLVTLNIEEVYDAARDDPATLKIITTVSADRGGDITLTEYITRWRNVTCAQTQWDALGASTTLSVQNCTPQGYTATQAYPSGSVQVMGGNIMLAP